MAYIVDEKFTENIYNGAGIFKAILTIDGVTIDNDQIASISISSPIIDDSKEILYLGSFISQKVKIHFKNMNEIEVNSGSEVSLTISQYIEPEDPEEEPEWEDVPIGKYIVDDLAENYFEKCEITCMDYGVKFKPNIDYSPCFTNGKATIREILQFICDYFDVALGYCPTTNDNIEIGTYDSTISGKQWISYIAEIKGCNAKIDREGKLTLQPLKQPQNISINALESASFELGEEFYISQVIFFDAIRNYTYGDETRNTLYIRQDNPFIENEMTILNIYNEVKDFSIYSLKTHNYGDFTLDAWDNIEYHLGEESYVTLNNNTITYNMSIMSDVETKIPTKQQIVTTNVVGGDDSVNIKKIKTNVDNLNATATILAEQQAETNNQLSQLEVSVNSITNLFQITGGNNLIKDSQLLLKDEGLWEYGQIGNYSLFPTSLKYPNENRNPLEYYYNEPDYIGGYDSTLIGKTVSTAKIGIKNGTMSTSNTNINNLVIGSLYTLSFKVSNDANTTSKISLYGNGSVVYEKVLDNQTTMEECSFSFIATSSTYKLRFQTTSTTNGYMYIYDLMLNKGDKQSWEVASGEIVSTIIKLSQMGIQVYSSNTEIATLITSEGFEVRRFANGKLYEVVTKFTKDGFISNKGILSELLVNSFKYRTVQYQGKETLILYKEGD